MTIRNIVMGRLGDYDGDAEKLAAASAELDRGLAGIAALDLPGQLSMTVARDAGIREGGWSFGIINDWVDVEAYRAYDVDAEHNVYRAIIGGVCEQIARVQLEL